jgi:hypothetical protein
MIKGLYREAGERARKIVEGKQSFTEFDMWVSFMAPAKPRMFTMHCEDLRRWALARTMDE